jgi:hypothetical protein
MTPFSHERATTVPIGPCGTAGAARVSKNHWAKWWEFFSLVREFTPNATPF